MQRSAFFAFIGAALYFSINTAAAAGDITQGNEMNGLLRILYNAASEWSPRLQGYALTLLGSLALIQLVWTFMPLVIKQADLGEIVGELIRFFMTVGFFYAIIEHSVPWATAVVNSFREAAGTASGLGRALQPGDMFAVAVDFSRIIVEGISAFHPGKAILIALVGCLVLLCFTFIAAFMFVTLVESYVIINAAVIFYGFGGSQWTREFAVAPLRFVIAVGAKLFVLTLIVGIIVTSAKSWLAAYTKDEASLMTLAGLALVCAYLTKTIPELIGGMVSGTSMGGGSAIGGIAAAGAAGAAAAIATVTTAGATAPAATGALGTLSSGSAGTVGSNGLAGAINSSLANASPSRGSTPLTGDFAGVGTSAGGSSATKAASPPGVGGFAPNIASAPTSSDAQRTAKQTGKAEQNSHGEEHKATPKGVGVSSGNSLSQATNGATKMLGVMMSITVPGMENAHGLSLNAASRSNAQDEANTSTIPVGAELAVEPLTAGSNVIRPASNTDTATGHLASLEVPGMTLKDDQQEKQS